MPEKVRSADLVEMIVQMSRALHSEDHAKGLYPAQWAALRFLSKATQEESTAAALARYQGMTLAPVARTIRTLEQQDYLVRKTNPSDMRSSILALTAKGRQLLANDPQIRLVKLLGRLTAEQRAAMSAGLHMVLMGLFEAK